MSKTDVKGAPIDVNDMKNWRVEFTSDALTWAEMDNTQRAKKAAEVIFKISVVLGALYFFICSLSFLAAGFRLVAGRQAGEIFRNTELFNNPIAGMLVGVLVTVLVQSSSTSTSIIITMVAAELFTVKQAINLIMGANIGTSVTSTIVALGQSGDPDEFRRAFAAATVHDMFNFLSVIVLLPLEAATGYLASVSKAIIDGQDLEQGDEPEEFLSLLTKPVTKWLISVDKGVIKDIATADEDELDDIKDERILKYFFGHTAKYDEDGAFDGYETGHITSDDISDSAAGIIILIVALIILCTMLFTVVYTLKSLFKGRIAVWLHKSVNGNVPDIKCGAVTIPMGWLAGYIAIGMGVVITILVQSSSITTSVLTPLVGVGVINVERMFPVVLGANIGTCVTGVLAALAADPAKLYLTLQVAYSHLLFNFSGIFIWYVIWPLRRIPVNAAKFLGDTTAVYRWFAPAYLAFCFFLIPAVFMGISLASTALCVVVAVLVILVAIFVTVINVLQSRKPDSLPEKLRTWEWLPVWARSLEPMDRVVCVPLGEKICTPLCRVCTKKKKSTEESTTTIVDSGAAMA